MITEYQKAKIAAESVKLSAAMIESIELDGDISEISSVNTRCEISNGYYLFITIDETDRDFLWITLENKNGSIDEQDTKGFTAESIEQAVCVLLSRNNI